MRTLVSATLIALSFGTAGCAGETVALTEVLNYGRCTNLDAGVRVVTLEEVAEIRGMTLLGGPDAATAEPTDLPVLIAISRGEQPTTGYAMNLKESRLRVQTLEIIVDWESPPPDAMTAQMVTHPCLVLGLPRPTPAAVTVRTTGGDLIGRLDFPG